ncbi:heavy metal translocating P-type ATPase [Paenibacillus rhizovicinus]|nr:heavy metal translocating P-type ATPase [Paenibacillus rhizovicinus]
MSGYATFVRGLRNLLRFRFNIDTLMTIALVGAVGIGDWQEAAFVALLFGLNEWLEGLGMEKACRSMESLLQLAPKEALRLTDGREELVPISALVPGDLVLVRSGALIPSDGIVRHGHSSVNEAAITGESLPVDKAAGDNVFAGTLNNEGVLRVSITRAYKDSSLSKILHLVAEAQETKTPTELFINRFSRYYTPLIIAVAVLVLLLPPLLYGGDWSNWLYQSLAVLIVGCPCALILSSPIAILSGITRAARCGILIKGGVHLEQLGRINLLAFDKTGTLTKGEPRVEDCVVFDARLHQIAGALEHGSSHPLAKAVLKAVTAYGIAPAVAENLQTVSGQGVTGVIEGIAYRIGNENSLSGPVLTNEVTRAIGRLKQAGMTLVIVSNDSRVLGIYGIADEIREESRSVIESLRRLGIRKTVMLTGDHEATARKVAEATGITDYIAGLLPEDKVDRVKALSSRHKVAMIGDGINDAPALASASLGIAMGKGTDSAIETADIVLMQDHLGMLPEAVKVAKRVNRTIRFNIGLALALKLIALLLTIPGWLTLWIAILSDMGATILVSLISLTILMDARKKTAPVKERPENRETRV